MAVMTTSTTATASGSASAPPSAPPAALAPRHPPRPRSLLSPEATCWLADIAAHVRSLDPIVIGAAAILETSGYERSGVQLTLDL